MESGRPIMMFDADSQFDSIESYLRFYGLDFEGKGIEHQFLGFKSNGYRLAGHVFVPDGYKATVFLLHGFVCHCGLLGHLIEYLTGHQFAVACFDLPGHGLSGGQRAEIDDFSQYSEALRDFAGEVIPRLHGPYHIIGYSLGGATVLDYLFAGKNDIFDKVILAGPLVHCIFYRLLKLGFRLCRPFKKDVRRLFRNNSSDKEFLEFVKTKDPLLTTRVPLKWPRAFYAWNDRILSAQPCDRAIKLIQGIGDTTVDWRFNIKFLESKFSDVEVSLIKHCGHEMFNEAVDIRNEVFSQISNWLGR